jgi:hypothetical protein
MSTFFSSGVQLEGNNTIRWVIIGDRNYSTIGALVLLIYSNMLNPIVISWLL